MMFFSKKIVSCFISLTEYTLQIIHCKYAEIGLHPELFYKIRVCSIILMESILRSQNT